MNACSVEAVSQENSRRIKDLNVKMEPLMYLDENEGECFYTFGVGKDFLTMNTGLFSHFYLIFNFSVSVTRFYNQKKVFLKATDVYLMLWLMRICEDAEFVSSSKEYRRQ